MKRHVCAGAGFLALAFIPATGIFFADHGIDPMGSPVGQASKALQKKLAQ